MNGILLGIHPSGYTSFNYDISTVPGVVYGDDNVLAVHVDATQSEGWWYEGKWSERRKRRSRSRRGRIEMERDIKGERWKWREIEVERDRNGEKVK